MGDLGRRLGERFAHLGGQDGGKIVRVPHDQLVPAPQRIGPLARRLRRPFGLGLAGAGDRGLRLRRAHVRNVGQMLAGGGVDDREGRDVGGKAQPGGIGNRREQVRVLQAAREIVRQGQAVSSR